MFFYLWGDEIWQESEETKWAFLHKPLAIMAIEAASSKGLPVIYNTVEHTAYSFPLTERTNGFIVISRRRRQFWLAEHIDYLW